MNTTISIKRIISQYVEKQRFEFQSVFSSSQAIEQLTSLIQEIQMLTSGGMDAKKIMLVLNNVNDELIPTQPLSLEELKNIQDQISTYEYKKKVDTYTMVYSLISSLNGKGVISEQEL